MVRGHCRNRGIDVGDVVAGRPRKIDLHQLRGEIAAEAAHPIAPGAEAQDDVALPDLRV